MPFYGEVINLFTQSHKNLRLNYSYEYFQGGTRSGLGLGTRLDFHCFKKGFTPFYQKLFCCRSNSLFTSSSECL